MGIVDAVWGRRECMGLQARNNQIKDSEKSDLDNQSIRSDSSLIRARRYTWKRTARHGLGADMNTYREYPERPTI